MRSRPSHADSLDEVLAEAWRLLGRGVSDRRSSFHNPTLASVDAQGRPHLRTVVLRGFDPATRRLTIHTDRRSTKLREIEARPFVSLQVYDRSASLQVRLDAVAAIHLDDAVTRSAWMQSPAMSRLAYAINPAPGTPIPAPLAAPDDAEAGAANFAVLQVVFDRLEWLWLSCEGHRRAAFTWRAYGELEATWLVP